MIKPIITDKSKILRNQTEKITDFNSIYLKRIIKNLRDTLKKTPNGIGLAAPQIGESLKIFVIDSQLAKSLKISDVFINPKIISSSFKKERLEEGCLSVPEVYGFIKRHKSVRLESYDENGKQFIVETRGLLSQIFQHEVDHLNGILFIDKAVKLLEITKDKS